MCCRRFPSRYALVTPTVIIVSVVAADIIVITLIRIFSVAGVVTVVVIVAAPAARIVFLGRIPMFRSPGFFVFMIALPVP